MKIELYIQNQLIELDESVQFTINKEFTDLTNPSSIINDWTKEISIPFTVHNNTVFGNIFIPNTVEVGYSTQRFMQFNPHEKLDFKLIYNGEILMIGYAKITSVVQSQGKGYYNITLNGELGKIFSELKKITFNIKQYENPEDINRYYIDGSQYLDTYINRNLVATSFTTLPTNLTLNSPHIIQPSRTVLNAFRQNAQDVTNTFTNYYVYPIQNLDAIYIDKIVADFAVGSKSYVLFYSQPQLTGLLDTRYNLPPNDVITDIKITNIPTGANYLVINCRNNYKPNVMLNQPYTDIVGFIPVNSYSNNFDFKSIEVNGNIKSISEFIDENADTSLLNTNAESIVGDGMLPRSMNEFRSYHQQPYIYFNKLFQIFNKQLLKMFPEYSIELDEDWFNEDNEHYANLCYTLKRLVNEEEGSTIESNYLLGTDTITIPANSSTPTMSSFNIVINPSVAKIPMYSSNAFDTSDLNSTTLNTDLYFKAVVKCDAWKNVDIVDGSCILLDVTLTDGSDYTETYSYVTGKANPVNHISVPYTITRRKIEDEYIISFVCPFTTILSKTKFVNKCQVNISARIVGNLLNKNLLTNDVKLTLEDSIVYLSTGNILKRSNTPFTLNDLWNNEYNLFDEILHYCKMYGILIFVEDNIIKFKKRTNFFKDYTIENWDDKVDFSNDFTLIPSMLEDKYLKFNYKEDNTLLNQEYKELYNVNYGEIKVNTNYRFNDNTKNIFDLEAYNTILYSPVINNIARMVNSDSFSKNIVSEVYLHLSDSDNKYVGKFGSYFIRKNTNAQVDSTAGSGTIKITDDSSLMVSNNVYCYNYNNVSFMTLINQLPNIDIVGSDKVVCLYNQPMLSYVYNSTYSDTQGIYQKFWNNFIEELYNMNNKKITCYVHLTAQDFKDFRFNKFVCVKDQLYLVNKIYDFNIESNELTKVELISINDINNYIN